MSSLSFALDVVTGDGPSRVAVQADALAQLEPSAYAFVVVDRTVRELHLRQGALARADLPTFVVEPGEASKSFATLEALLEAMAAAGLERGATLLAIGGGVTTDLAGLAAALFHRGIAWHAAPTTLLAQVDASVGGKTAINGRHAKNLFGSFHAPRQVIVDPRVLTTLAAEEWRSGLGEVVKAALLGARGIAAVQASSAPAEPPGDGPPATTHLLDDLEALVADGHLTGTTPGAAQLEAIAGVVTACIDFKARVVAADYKEAGERALLNLGHTFGHALEAASRFAVPHGIAVAAGIGLAFERSAREGVLADAALPARFAALARALELPPDLATLNAAYGLALTPAELAPHMLSDKKRARGALRLVLPRALGDAVVFEARDA